MVLFGLGEAGCLNTYEGQNVHGKDGAFGLVVHCAGVRDCDGDDGSLFVLRNERNGPWEISGTPSVC